MAETVAVSVLALAPVVCLLLAAPVLLKGDWRLRGIAVLGFVLASGSSVLGSLSVVTYEGAGSPYWPFVAVALACITVALAIEVALLRRLRR